MAVEADDVLAAIEEHSKAVGTSVAGVKSTVETLQRKFDEEIANREDMERKLNSLRVAGNDAGPDSFNPAEQFKRAVKGWYPNRESQLASINYQEYREAFAKYVRGGLEMLGADERKAMQVGIDSDGGFIAPSEFSLTLIQFETNNSVMRRIARVLPMGSGEIEFAASLTRPSVGWVSETGSRSETSTPMLGKFRLPAREMYAMPEITQRLIDDSLFGIEGFLGEEVGLAFAEEEDAQFIAGDGVSMPQGFTKYPTAAVADSAGTRPWGTIEHIATGQSGAWPATDAAIYDKLVDMVHALRPGYRRNASWVMPTAAISKLRKMKTATTNEPLWQPSMAAGQPDRLLGYVVHEAEQMPAIAANSLSVAFADWRRAYWIGDRLGVRVLRDPYTNKPYVRFYTTKRVAGGVADSSAIKLLKFSST